MVVKQLFEYPVKGLRGNSIACASVNSRGLNHDRRWMLVDSSGSFISQRQMPSLTGLQPLFQDKLRIVHLQSDEIMTIALEEFTIAKEVEIWGQVVIGHGTDTEINEKLSKIVGQSVELIYMNDTDQRPIKSAKEGEIVSFADGYPVLLTGTASLADLNQKLEKPIEIDRFRTNIHVATGSPFEEELWQRIKVGEVVFRVVKKCARCQVINIDQDTGAPSKEPLQTLSTYRKEGNKVNFGVNLIPETTGIIHEGDQVVVLN